MNFVSMIFGWHGGSSMGAVPLDALLNEKTTLNSRATAYAVEDGPPVTDHVVQESEQLTLDGWVTAADITLLGGLTARVASGGAAAFGRSGSAGRSKLIGAKDALRKIHADRLPITITTGLDVYADFAMESCTIGRGNGGGDRFEISASFRRIRKVTLRQADIPPEQTSGSAMGKAGTTRANAGKTSGTAVSPQQRTRAFDAGVLST